MSINLSLLEDAAALGDCRILQEYSGELVDSYFAHVLGHACRFGGIECVKALVSSTRSGGISTARYKSDGFHRVTSYSCMLLDYCPWGDYCIPIHMYGWHRCSILSKEVKRTISKAERLQILDLLLEYQDLINFDPGVLLFYAILCEDHDIVSALLARGIRLSHVVCRDIFSKSPGMYWYAFVRILDCGEMYFERFLDIAKSLCQASEGETLHCTMKLLEQNSVVFDNVDILRLTLQYFNYSSLNKLQMMKQCMGDYAIEYLELFEEVGWLKRAASYNALFDYVSRLSKNKTEIVAWLLDFRNRTWDLAVEQEKAAKLAERELTASPDSVYMLRKLWGFKKLDNDTLQIISYKGNSTKVVVPSEIGKRKVTAIGENAFTRYSKNAGSCSITSITLPEGITCLHNYAFAALNALRSINLPKSLRDIGSGCFYNCVSLQTVTIPDDIHTLETSAFEGCKNLKTVILPEGIKEIKYFAFAQCTRLRELHIPAATKAIADRAFNANTTLLVHRGSPAIRYCSRHGIMHKLVD